MPTQDISSVLGEEGPKLARTLCWFIYGLKGLGPSITVARIIMNYQPDPANDRYTKFQNLL